MEKHQDINEPSSKRARLETSKYIDSVRNKVVDVGGAQTALEASDTTEAALAELASQLKDFNSKRKESKSDKLKRKLEEAHENVVFKIKDTLEDIANIRDSTGNVQKSRKLRPRKNLIKSVQKMSNFFETLRAASSVPIDERNEQQVADQEVLMQKIAELSSMVKGLNHQIAFISSGQTSFRTPSVSTTDPISPQQRVPTPPRSPPKRKQMQSPPRRPQIHHNISADILKRVKLRSVPKSPGGTPIAQRRSPRMQQKSLIDALKRRFDAMHDSPVKKEFLEEDSESDFETAPNTPE